MSQNSNETIAKLGALIQVLEEDIDNLSEETLLAEIALEAGGVVGMTVSFNSIFESAEKNVKRQRLLNAKEGYKKATLQNVGMPTSDNVLVWPIEKKRALLTTIYDQDNSITMAARNDENSESDIDAILEDLIALGAIDSQGNPT
jgi:hypothetical protein